MLVPGMGFGSWHLARVVLRIFRLKLAAHQLFGNTPPFRRKEPNDFAALFLCYSHCLGQVTVTANHHSAVERVLVGIANEVCRQINI